MKKMLALCFILSVFQCLAQKSVFEQDTVAFKYYETGEKDELVSRVSRTKDENEIDTVRDWRYVFIDKNKVVHWIEKSTNYQAHHMLHLALEKAGVKDTNIHEFPDFKVIRQGLNFKYQTVGKNPKIIFQGSLSRNGIKKAPFFLAWSIPLGVGWDYQYENMNYVKDTIVKFAGKSILCHHFTKFETDFPKNVMSFGEYFTEIYFEKISLLPILISRRSLSRYYNTERSEDGNKIGYTLLYFHKRIEPRW